MSDHSRTLEYPLEHLADKAGNLSAFSGFSLLHVKKSVSELLSLIGKSTIFDQYTAHDITHINAMLKLLSWLLPEETVENLTPADALLITLSVYLHDLGMLVTEREYERRNETDFPSFKSNNLLSGKDSDDYKIKIDDLGKESADRFFYQEFVRANHAERIQEWLQGSPPDKLGDANEAAAALCDLLRDLPQQFLDDLGKVCRSHHLDDLEDTKKYSLKKAYGSSADEIVNLQFAAIMLRTADLLHMTSDRTPTITFRVTNPTDPVSQNEWAKQMGVNQVCSKIGIDIEGHVSEAAPRDTIEIHAYFIDAEPYFALTTFLKYVQMEITQCNRWSIDSVAKGSKLKFPWKHVDLSTIETKGFLSQSFSFEVDQPRILKLLTGHTLYNDSGVVLREVIQNALDAVRLRKYEDERRGVSVKEGHIHIKWNTKEKCLSVLDNGTGMTQEIIEQHFLTVGSSRYINERFVEQHPGFSSISRFGIGILSAFMVADHVDVYTSHSDEPEARHLSLRNLLGKYLIRLLDKSDPKVSELESSGTRIELKLRPSANISDIKKICRQWVLVPDIMTFLQIDDGPQIRIGFDSTADALQDIISRHSSHFTQHSKIEVRTQKIRGIEVSFPVYWSEYFNDWALLKLPADEYDYRGIIDESASEKIRQELGISVHGIRVQSGQYGYRNPNVMVLANATGVNAPRTNVARSGLEDMDSTDEVYRAIYTALLNHVENECHRILGDSSCSITWAADEASYLLNPVLTGAVSHPKIHRECVDKVKLQLIEKNNTREYIAPLALKEHALWTTDCPLIDHAERLLREAPNKASLADLSELLGVGKPPEGIMLCKGGIPLNYILREREIDHVVIKRNERRVDYRWVDINIEPQWITPAREVRQSMRAGDMFSRKDYQVFVAGSTVSVVGSNGFSGVIANRNIRIFADNELGKLYTDIIVMMNQKSNDRNKAITVYQALNGMLRLNFSEITEERLSKSIERDHFKCPSEFDVDRIMNTFQNSGPIFSPWAWERNKEE